MQWEIGDFILSDNKELLDIYVVFDMLSNTYWAKGRSKEAIDESIKNSIAFGLYYDKKQIGFARAVTDKATFSWIADVVILDKYRGKGLGKWLVKSILEHPDVKNTKSMLVTKDAHGLYEQFGFKREECMRRIPYSI